MTDAGSRTVFTGANLLDGLNPSRPATVVVEGDRVVSVTDEAPAAGPPSASGPGGGARVVDLGGRTLMPGMVSCHFHATYHELGSRTAPFGLEEPPALQAVRAVRNLERVLDCGFTSAVSAGAPHVIDPAMRTAIAQGAVRGPRFVPGSRDVSTTGHVNDSAPWYWEVRSRGALHLCDGPDEFRRAVREEVREGARIIKMFVTGGHGTVGPAERTEMSREEMSAGIEAAHARGAMVRGHIANREALMMALDCGIDVVDHGDGLDDAGIERLVETRTPLVPSLFFPFRLWSSLQGGGFGFTDSLRADLDAALEVLPRANAAGVTMVIGDDYGAVGFPHGIYGEELAFYVDEVGIAPLDVLRWATVNGAALMGRSDDLGSVEAGKLADLLVVEGDPSRDMSVLADSANVVAVMKGGVLMKGEEFMKSVTIGATFGT
jgi:imidazolonepropionase-like amidohydrolase